MRSWFCMEIRIKHEIYARIVGLCTINRIKKTGPTA